MKDANRISKKNEMHFETDQVKIYFSETSITEYYVGLSPVDLVVLFAAATLFTHLNSSLTKLCICVCTHDNVFRGDAHLVER